MNRPGDPSAPFLPMLAALAGLALCLDPALAAGQAPSAPSGDDRGGLRYLAVLEFKNASSLATTEVELLAEEVRAASLVLPRDQFRLITRENILELLPPDRDLAECSGSQCEVQAGRLVGADYVVSGAVTPFEGRISLVLKTFDTRKSSILAQETIDGAGALELRDRLRTVAARMFTTTLGPSSRGPVRAAPSIPGGAAPTSWNPRIVQVSVDSMPTGASVRFNGQDVGSTPWTDFVEPGSAVIELSRANYKTARHKVTLTEGQGSQRFSFPLDPNFAVLSFRSSPAAARVLVDGTMLCPSTPCIVEPVSPGLHTLEIALDRHHPFKETVQLSAGETKTIDVPLVPRYGMLQVFATRPDGSPVQASVRLDGSDVPDRTPVAWKLLEGPHEVVVIDPLMPSETRTVRAVVPFEGTERKRIELADPSSLNAEVFRRRGLQERSWGIGLTFTGLGSGLVGLLANLVALDAGRDAARTGNRSKYDHARRGTYAAYGFYGAGALLMIIGPVVWKAGSNHLDKAERLRRNRPAAVVPWLSPGGGGASVVMDF